MGRKGGKRAVDDAIRLLDDAGIWIRTTLMVGHHGEGEKEFSELEEFVNSGIIGSMGAFAYSPEVGTKSSLAPQMNWKEKEGRLKRIMKLQKQVSKKRLKAYAGRKEKVLIEGLHPETDMLLRARTSFQAPDVDGITIINEGLSGFGKMASARITGSTDYDLIGRIE
jgi:ribosomal protein S12 methylthiotransferase